MRIVIKNLPQFITEKEIINEFIKVGEITDCFIPKDVNGKSRRICFIGYKDENSCQLAIQKMNDIYLHNHKISVSPCKQQENRCVSEAEERLALYHSRLFVMYLPKVDTSLLKDELQKFGEISSLDFIEKDLYYNCELVYKDSKDALNVLKNVTEILGKNILVKPNKEKNNEKQIEHYNSLFFNFESVVRRICENQKLNKSVLVDLKDNELGSKMALLETNLVNQTNKFLLKNKIDLSNLTKEKNKKMMIVRNTKIEKCLDFMNVKCRMNISPSGTLALLKFDTEEDAYKCYRSINLRRYNDSVVYCEFAPICQISEPKVNKPVEVDSDANKTTNKLLIKNLPFQATKLDVQRLFKGKFNFTNVRIPKKRDGNSRGFCFVELDSEKKVLEAIDYFGKSTHLYGRRLILEKAKE